MISELKTNFHEIIDNYKIPALSATMSVSTAIGSAFVACAFASSPLAPFGVIAGAVLGSTKILATKSDSSTELEQKKINSNEKDSRSTHNWNKYYGDHRDSIPEFENTNPDIYEDICKYCSAKKIDETSLYTKALVSKSTFSKIRNMKRSGYKPDKSTIIRLSLVLRLTLPETQMLLDKLGYVLSNSLVIDKVVAWCIEHNCYDFDTMDDILIANDIPNTLMPQGLA